MAKSQTAAPTFAPVSAPPPRVKEPALKVEDATALIESLQSEDVDWISDQIEYADARTAHTAVHRYRSAILHHGLMPEGLTLRSRFVNGFLYLRLGEPRGANGAEATE